MQTFSFKKNNCKSKLFDFDLKYKYNSLSKSKINFIRTYKAHIKHILDKKVINSMGYIINKGVR